MLEKELSLIFISRLSPDGAVSREVRTFDCEYSASCKGDCIVCPPLKDRITEIASEEPQSIHEVIGVGSYDLLSGVIGQIEGTSLESNYLEHKN